MLVQILSILTIWVGLKKIFVSRPVIILIIIFNYVIGSIKIIWLWHFVSTINYLNLNSNRNIRSIQLLQYCRCLNRNIMQVDILHRVSNFINYFNNINPSAMHQFVIIYIYMYVCIYLSVYLLRNWIWLYCLDMTNARR